MDKGQSLLKWLAIAALVEWLLVRTFTRAAIHVPKSPLMISVYTSINQIGQVAAAFVALLGFCILLWLAWRTRNAIISPLILVGLAGLSLLFLFVVPPAWLALTYQLLAVTAVILIISTGFLQRAGEPGKRLGWLDKIGLLLPAGALLAGLLVQLLPNLYTLLSWPGPPPLTSLLFNLGEILVIGSVLIWWWRYGRIASWHPWLLAAMPALLFALIFYRDPAMTGILTIWSTGLTLFLPWPVYTLALWLAGVTVLANWQERPTVAYAILLLMSAGYAPQLSSQLFCALIALWLMAQPLPRSNEQPILEQQSNKRLIEPKLLPEN